MQTFWTPPVTETNPKDSAVSHPSDIKYPIDTKFDLFDSSEDDRFTCNQERFHRSQIEESDDRYMMGYQGKVHGSQIEESLQYKMLVLEKEKLLLENENLKLKERTRHRTREPYGSDEDVAADQFLKSAFRRHFTPEQYEIQLTGKWHELSMDQGLLAYVKAFRVFVQEIPSTPEKERWNALQYKIDQKARDYLELKGITTSTPALEALYYFAAGHEKEENGRKRAHATAFSPRQDEGNQEKPTLPKNRKVKVDKAKYDHVEVTMSNYNDFKVLPCITRNLSAFINARNGCRYCRALNVDPEHTAAKCALEHRGKKKEVGKESRDIIVRFK